MHVIDFCIYTSTFVAVNSKKYIRRKYSSNSICTIGFWNPNPCRSLGNLITGSEQEGVCRGLAVCRGLGIDQKVSIRLTRLLLYYNPQQQFHLLIIDLHSQMAVAVSIYGFTASPEPHLTAYIEF